MIHTHLKAGAQKKIVLGPEKIVIIHKIYNESQLLALVKWQRK